MNDLNGTPLKSLAINDCSSKEILAQKLTIVRFFLERVQAWTGQRTKSKQSCFFMIQSAQVSLRWRRIEGLCYSYCILRRKLFYSPPPHTFNHSVAFPPSRSGSRPAAAAISPSFLAATTQQQQRQTGAATSVECTWPLISAAIRNAARTPNGGRVVSIRPSVVLVAATHLLSFSSSSMRKKEGRRGGENCQVKQG